MSGSIYHGSNDHYHFLTEAFEAFAHANVLRRDEADHTSRNQDLGTSVADLALMAEKGVHQ